MGRFVAADLLTTNIDGIRLHDKPLPLDDELWAGTVEFRIMELLPAVLVKKPGLLRLPEDLPEDVAAVMHAIRHGKAAAPFRGVPPERYLPWVSEVGRKGKSPSVPKSFRFKHEDVMRLSKLRKNLPAWSDTEVIPMALELLESSPTPS